MRYPVTGPGRVVTSSSLADSAMLTIFQVVTSGIELNGILAIPEGTGCETQDRID
jgi:hypothetical protein